MSDQKNFGSGPEDAHDCMEWEEDSCIERHDPGTGECGTSSGDPNLISGCLNNQPGTSGYIGLKRKSSFSSPLATKISRNIYNEKQQQEAHLLVNETNLNNTSEVVPASKIILPEPHELSSSVTSDNKSVASISGCIDSSDFNVSAHDTDNTSTTAFQSGTCHSCLDLDVMRGKIISPLDAVGLLTHTKRKSFFCHFCHSKWADEEKLRRHLTSHAIGANSSARKRFLFRKQEEEHCKCLKCGMFFSVIKHHEICSNSSDSDD